MRLHERVGPAATTVSAIADEAGVTRVTVYRHFSDETALVVACSAHWGERHSRPDSSRWGTISDPVVRLRTALSETYGWADAAAPMMTKVYRDLDAMPPFVARFLAEDEATRVEVLAKGFGGRGRTAVLLRAALRHALHIRTWQSLCGDGGLTAEQAIQLMAGAVLAAIQSPPTTFTPPTTRP